MNTTQWSFISWLVALCIIMVYLAYLGEWLFAAGQFVAIIGINITYSKMYSDDLEEAKHKFYQIGKRDKHG